MPTSRKTLTCAVVCVLGTALAASVPAAATAKPHSCARAKSTTVDRNGVARVYRVRTRNGSKLFGCRRATGKRVLLYEASNEPYVNVSYRNVRLAGGFVAWAWSVTDTSCKASCEPGYVATTTGIRVWDLRRGRVRRITDTAPLGGALVLSRLGGVAWASASAGNRVDIRMSVRPGDNRLIDRGSIDARSLAIEITIISWRRDGVERFARLR